MIVKIVLMFTLITIWIGLLVALINLFGATKFWLGHATERTQLKPLKRYPTVTIVVPAHNEELVISQTVQAILDMAYPSDKLELLLYADNCADNTANEMLKVVSKPEYAKQTIKVIRRKGTGGKAGVLNDALKIAQGEYMAVYDADAMPEEHALYFLMRKIQENPKDYVAAYGRNKTRNAQQNFLTRCINQEIMVTQRIRHIALWNLFGIGYIPGTNFVILTSAMKEMGGWQNGALTEDTDLSFKLMIQGKQIALAYQSEAFQQKPEHLKDYYYQRLRWAKGNYQVVFMNFKHLFDRSHWRVKLEEVYFISNFFWFNLAVILSDILFLINIGVGALSLIIPGQGLVIPFTFGTNALLLYQVLLINWVLMILLSILQVNLSLATQFGQTNPQQLWLALAAYFTYGQLFIAVSVHAFCSLMVDQITGRKAHWVKTKRFAD